MNNNIDSKIVLFLSYSGIVFCLTFIIGLFAGVSFFAIIFRSLIFSLFASVILLVIVKLLPIIFPNVVFSQEESTTRLETKTLDLDSEAFAFDEEIPSIDSPNANLQAQSYSNASSSVNIVLDDAERTGDGYAATVPSSEGAPVMRQSTEEELSEMEEESFQSTIEDASVPNLSANASSESNRKDIRKQQREVHNVEKIVSSRERVEAQKLQADNEPLRKEIESTKLEFEASPEKVSKAVASWIKNDDNSK